MFEVTVEQQFAAGHSLRFYKGACENVHGHNFKVHVTIEGEKLDQAGMLVDFLDVRASMQEVIAKLDHRFLNDIEPFTHVNPSAENIAEYICQQMTPGMAAGTRITAVKVWETDFQSATYRP